MEEVRDGRWRKVTRWQDPDGWGRGLVVVAQQQDPDDGWWRWRVPGGGRRRQLGMVMMGGLSGIRGIASAGDRRWVVGRASLTGGASGPGWAVVVGGGGASGPGVGGGGGASGPG